MVTIKMTNQTVLFDDGFRATTGKPILKIKKSLSTFIESIVKEVRQQPKHIQKRFRKILKYTFLLAIPLSATSKVQASGNYLLLDNGYESKLLPPEITSILQELILTAGMLGVLLAILCLMAAGAYRMFGQRDKAQKWSKDIIGGLCLILVSPIIVMILATLTNLIFKNVGLDIFF